jgi:hypothetical protein
MNASVIGGPWAEALLAHGQDAQLLGPHKAPSNKKTNHARLLVCV